MLMSTAVTGRGTVRIRDPQGGNYDSRGREFKQSSPPTRRAQRARPPGVCGGAANSFTLRVSSSNEMRAVCLACIFTSIWAAPYHGQSVVDAIQWATAKVFRVSLHDLVFGTTTLHINDYPEQLRLARAAAFYLCRKHAGLAAATIARAFNRRSPAVAYAVRSIERLLTEEPRLGELLSEVEREFGPSIGTNDGA